MTELTASRTLVKSPPELWAECSEAASLGRHLGQFGDIRITRLEPETAVAWEGERASGTVRLEPSGWGTRVVLTAAPVGAEAEEVALEPAAAEGAQGATEAAAADVPEVPAQPADGGPDGKADPATAPAPRTARGPLALLRALFARWRVLDEPAPAEDAVEQPAAGSDPAPASEPEPAPASEPEPEPAPDLGPALERSPETPAEPAGEAPVASAGELAALERALDSLGQAHHRPFSRP